MFGANAIEEGTYYIYLGQVNCWKSNVSYKFVHCVCLKVLCSFMHGCFVASFWKIGNVYGSHAITRASILHAMHSLQILLTYICTWYAFELRCHKIWEIL